jgi:hypothetical protein
VRKLWHLVPFDDAAKHFTRDAIWEGEQSTFGVTREPAPRNEIEESNRTTYFTESGRGGPPGAG